MGKKIVKVTAYQYLKLLCYIHALVSEGELQSLRGRKGLLHISVMAY